MTVTSLVLQSWQAQFADPTSLRLVVPMIASKDAGVPLVNHLQVDDMMAYLSPDDSPQAANLLPRSRTGCWTCRSRKVKCDEARPVCSQCARLGHSCDYQPRLSFRNDTRRIVGRMSEVSTKGNAVWDPTSPMRRAKSRTPSAGEEDSLPPFSMLTSDEDRERKAEASSPGTYHVVVNPDSFSNLPEYTEATSPAGLSVRSRKGRLAKGGIRTERERPAVTSNGTGTDPNVVVLRRFEDAARRPPSNGRSSRLSPASDTTSYHSPAPTTSTSTSTTPQHAPPSMKAEDSYFSAVFAQYETRSSEDEALMENFRNVVWRQLIPVEYVGSHSPGLEMNKNSLGADVFEHEAARFVPLYHAIMALSALSLADQDTSQNINALQHYQQAFTSLQTSLHCNDDLTSDGLFLTHFLLLVYEIAAAERKGSNLWSHHISRLLHITIMRRASFGRERFPFIIWWVCNVDLYALISGAGSGEFVGAMINGNMLPGPESILYPTGTSTDDNGVSVIYPEEQESLPTILQLSYDTFMAAASLGFLAAEARNGMMESAAFAGMEYAMMAFSPSEQWHQDVLGLQQRLRALWESPEAVFLMRHRGNLPKRSREVLEQASTMFHVLQLYSFTSMWPGQRLQSGGALEQVVHHHAAAILQIAQGIVQADRFDRRFIIFPLFLAGASLGMNSPLKKRAMELLGLIEERGMGRNAATARLLLQLVVERQNGRFVSAGHTLDVDWFELMSQHGFQLVNFGL